MQNVEVRTIQVNVRLNADEEERLDRIAAHYSVSPATAVRLLIKAKSDELDAASPAPKPRRK
jgi:predicted DNA-binding protein